MNFKQIKLKKEFIHGHSIVQVPNSGPGKKGLASSQLTATSTQTVTDSLISCRMKTV